MTDLSTPPRRRSAGLGFRLALVLPSLALVGFIFTGSAANRQSVTTNAPTASSPPAAAAAKAELRATDRHQIGRAHV